jgi:hypothetical protein
MPAIVSYSTVQECLADMYEYSYWKWKWRVESGEVKVSTSRRQSVKYCIVCTYKDWLRLRLGTGTSRLEYSTLVRAVDTTIQSTSKKIKVRTW